MQGSFNQQQTALFACTTIIFYHYITMAAAHQISSSWIKSPEDIHPITGFRHIQDPGLHNASVEGTQIQLFHLQPKN